MKTVIDLAVYTLTPVLYVLLLAGALLGLAIGAMLIFDSERVMRWNYLLNRWYSTRRALRPLDQPIDVKRAIYRWHRLLGALVFAGALYTLDVLTFRYQSGALVGVFRDLARPDVLQLVFESVRILLIVGNLAGLLVGLVLCFRPSLLKGLEDWGDRHYSGRESTKPLEIMRYQPDDFVRARPKIVGVLLVLGSAYVLIALGLAIL